MKIIGPSTLTRTSAATDTAKVLSIESGAISVSSDFGASGVGTLCLAAQTRLR